MLTEHEKEILAVVRTKIRALSGITEYHAYELERSFDLVKGAFDETPEQFARWSHMTIVVDHEMFEQAGFDMRAVTKADMDTLADEMNDYWVGGKSWDAAIEYAAQGVLDPTPERCECCLAGTFTPSPHGDCLNCDHEHLDHQEADDED